MAERQREVGAAAPRGHGVALARGDQTERDGLAGEGDGQQRAVERDGRQVGGAGQRHDVERDAPLAAHVVDEAAGDERRARRGGDRGVAAEGERVAGRQGVRRRLRERLHRRQQQVPAEAEAEQQLVAVLVL